MTPLILELQKKIDLLEQIAEDEGIETFASIYKEFLGQVKTQDDIQDKLEEFYYVIQSGTDCDGGSAFGMSFHETAQEAEEKLNENVEYSDGMTYMLTRYTIAKEYCRDWRRDIYVEYDRVIKYQEKIKKRRNKNQ